MGIFFGTVAPLLCTRFVLFVILSIWDNMPEVSITAYFSVTSHPALVHSILCVSYLPLCVPHSELYLFRWENKWWTSPQAHGLCKNKRWALPFCIVTLKLKTMQAMQFLKLGCTSCCCHCTQQIWCCKIIELKWYCSSKIKEKVISKQGFDHAVLFSDGLGMRLGMVTHAS